MPPPSEYILFKYRERFGYTHNDIREMDLDDLLKDMQIIAIENETKQEGQESSETELPPVIQQEEENSQDQQNPL